MDTGQGCQSCCSPLCFTASIESLFSQSARLDVCLHSPSLPRLHSFCVFFLNQSQNSVPPPPRQSHCSVSTGILIENLFPCAESECTALANRLIRWCNQKFVFFFYHIRLPLAGHSPVLCGETPDGRDHRHPAGLRKVQRRRLQVCFHTGMCIPLIFFHIVIRVNKMIGNFYMQLPPELHWLRPRVADS